MSNQLIELVDARVLKSNSTKKQYISDYLNEIIIKINNELKEAKISGKHYIITDIPFIFSIPNVTNTEAQRIIWSQTIEMLKNKNFIVKIYHTTDSCRLKITWIAPEEERIIQHQLNIIKDSSERF